MDLRNNYLSLEGKTVNRITNRPTRLYTYKIHATTRLVAMLQPALLASP